MDMSEKVMTTFKSWAEEYSPDLADAILELDDELLPLALSLRAKVFYSPMEAISEI
jgi:hypothetical protein